MSKSDHAKTARRNTRLGRIQALLAAASASAPVSVDGGTTAPARLPVCWSAASLAATNLEQVARVSISPSYGDDPGGEREASEDPSCSPWSVC